MPQQQGTYCASSAELRLEAVEGAVDEHQILKSDGLCEHLLDNKMPVLVAGIKDAEATIFSAVAADSQVAA